MLIWHCFYLHQNNSGSYFHGKFCFHIFGNNNKKPPYCFPGPNQPNLSWLQSWQVVALLRVHLSTCFSVKHNIHPVSQLDFTFNIHHLNPEQLLVTTIRIQPSDPVNSGKEHKNTMIVFSVTALLWHINMLKCFGKEPANKLSFHFVLLWWGLTYTSREICHTKRVVGRPASIHMWVGTFSKTKCPPWGTARNIHAVTGIDSAVVLKMSSTSTAGSNSRSSPHSWGGAKPQPDLFLHSLFSSANTQTRVMFSQWKLEAVSQPSLTNPATHNRVGKCEKWQQ